MVGEQRGKNLIFVGGCPRSGTTMVQLMLDSHPHVCGGPEFDRVPEIIGLRDKLRASVESGRISVYCSKEDVDKEIGLLIERLLVRYAEERNCRVISEKTPWNALVFEELLEIFPAAHFIFCVRDPRAVVASMLQVGSRAREKGLSSPGFTRNVYSAIETIKTTSEAGFRAVNQSNRVLTVMYERLVNDPRQETVRMCDFLGLPWSEEMVRPGETSHDGGIDGVWYTNAMFYSNPDPSRVHKWKDQLTVNQRAAVATSFGDDKNLKALGYEISEESIPVTSRLVGETRFKLYRGSKHLFGWFASLLMKRPFLGRITMKLLSAARAAQRH